MNGSKIRLLRHFARRLRRATVCRTMPNTAGFDAQGWMPAAGAYSL